ncbi:hypothetical protein [Spirulina major]|uniref:hypothetical protein n=1 Tax=Spirulina major TaxID=270636 RepID=UPI000935054F|nr:hypothetical protein [Spirulina major]
MQLKKRVTLLAAAIGGLSSFWIANPATAQVNALTYQDVRGFNTTEVTLTNSRGIVTLPGFQSATVVSRGQQAAVIGTASKWTFDPNQGIDQDHVSRRNGDPLVIDRVGNSTDKLYISNSNGNIEVWIFVNGVDISGWSASGQPYTYTGSLDLWLFGGQGNVRISSNNTVTLPAETAGIISLTSGVPDGFTLVQPSNASTAGTLPTNIPELNAADALNLQTTPNLPGVMAAQNQTTLRSNGVHTRIMPEWSPGLYQ